MKRERNSKRSLAPRKLPTECLCCGGANPWVINTVDFASTFRGVEHTVSASVNQCRYCDAISATPEQLDVISGKLREAHKAWVAKELKNAMKGLSITIDSLVQKTELARATVARASCGQLLIEANTEKFLWHEIDELRKEQIARIWTTMVPREVEHLVWTCEIKNLANEPQPSVQYDLVMRAAAHSPLPIPWEKYSEELNTGQSEYACA